MVTGRFVIADIKTDWAMNKEIVIGDIVSIETNAIRIFDRNNVVKKYEKELTVRNCNGNNCPPSSFDCWKNSDANGISYEEIPYAFEERVVSIFQKTGESNFSLNDCERWDTGGSGCRLQLRLVKLNIGNVRSR